MAIATESAAAPVDVLASPPTGDWALIEFFLALVTLAGSLYLTLGMGLIACTLCLYQRTFVMGMIGVLGVGVLARVKPPGTLPLLCLPLSAGGLAIVLMHVKLEYTGTLECPLGIGGVGSAPQQALLMQSLLFVLLLLDAVRRADCCPAWGPSFWAPCSRVALFRSGPPAPPIPAGGYKPGPINTCRPVYHPAPPDQITPQS